MSNQVNIEEIADFLGKEVGLTDWVEINQAQINKFADATGITRVLCVVPI